jgi:hypothetical protein
LEFFNGKKLIIDAKNTKYQSKNPYPNSHQMRSYLKSVDADLGFFVHSNSEISNLWFKISDESNTIRIIWTTLIPGHSDENLNQLFQV